MRLRRRYGTTGKRLLGVALLALVVGTTQAQAAGELAGTWRVTMDFNGNQMFATLTFAQKADGTYTGKWGSDDLSNVKFDGEKLSFERTMQMGEMEFTQDFAGTLKDGKISGTIGNDQFEFPISAEPKKAKSPAVGQWDINFNVMDQEIKARLIISEEPDGTLTAKWIEEQGEHRVSSVKYEDGKLTFTRQSTFPEMDFELETTYAGTIKGNELTGTLEAEMGSWQANGTRFGTPLIGTWELTSDVEQGPRTTTLTIEPDLTGTYAFFGSEIPIRNLKLEGNQVSFGAEMGFGDQGWRLDFAGKLDGGTLKGQMSNPMGTNEVTGKKTQAVVAPAASIAGTWELTSESPQGTRTNTLKIKPDMTGTYTSRNNETPISDLKVEGNQVTFKVTRSFNDQEFTMEYKATLEGNTLKGEIITERGSRPFTGKKTD
ncbi:MAG: hypothetical protein JW993_08875 [Sedimentisphaerales bacterium]|nr:hypothetical protein [Sedimentisphaerales bacterium]